MMRKSRSFVIQLFGLEFRIISRLFLLFGHRSSPVWGVRPSAVCTGVKRRYRTAHKVLDCLTIEGNCSNDCYSSVHSPEACSIAGEAQLLSLLASSTPATLLYFRVRLGISVTLQCLARLSAD